MNEQEKREKVIKGLECCISGNPAICKRVGCPYAEEHDGIGDTCIDHLMADAISLLKAQEPMVMTLEEYKALAKKPKKERDPVWEEWPGLESTWEMPNQAYGGYGTSWRCWTSRPTDEQREAVKWE